MTPFSNPHSPHILYTKIQNLPPQNSKAVKASTQCIIRKDNKTTFSAINAVIYSLKGLL